MTHEPVDAAARTRRFSSRHEMRVRAAGPQSKPEAPRGAMAAFERRLQVRRRARQDGAADFPPSGSLEPSQVEQDIAAAVQAERQLLEQQRERVLLELESGLRRCGPVRPSFAATVGGAEAELLRAEGRLARAFQEVHAADARTQHQLEAFRVRHGLERPAVYPESGLLAGAMLGLAAAFEASFSATLFANASEAGLLGGAAVALGLSAANVTLGFLAGFLGLRYLQHRRWPQRLLGAACAGAAALGAVALNVYAAMWREHAEAGAEPLLETGARLLGLTRPEAVILLMLGLAVWVFSTLKGFSGFDDPYPDFGKFARAARRSREDLAEAREDARAALDAPIDAARDAVAAALGGMAAGAAAMRAVYETGADRLAALDAEERRLHETGAALVQLYRQENASARRSPPPFCFAAEPLAPLDRAAGLDAAADLLARAEQALDTAQQEAAAGMKRLAAMAEAAAARLEGGAA